MTTPAIPTTSNGPSNALLAQLEQAGKDELEVLKPQIGALVRKFVKQYEAKLSGVTGIIERRVIDSIVDAIFGPEQEVAS